MILTHVSMEERALRGQDLITFVNAPQTSLVPTVLRVRMVLAWLMAIVVRARAII